MHGHILPEADLATVSGPAQESLGRHCEKWERFPVGLPPLLLLLRPSVPQSHSQSDGLWSVGGAAISAMR